MRGISVSFLALAAVAVISATLYLQYKPGEITLENQLLFPNLGKQLDRIVEVKFEKGASSFTLHRKGEDLWLVQERAGYPADSAKVRGLLLGTAGLRRIEEKTKNPERYVRLGLAEAKEKGREDKQAARITLWSEEETQPLADFFLGRHGIAKGRRSLEEMYVRVQGDPMAWLVEGNLPHDHEVAGWLKKDILTLDPERIREVRVTRADGKVITIEKNDPSVFDYHVTGVPKTAGSMSTRAINGIPIAMAKLQLQDVRRRQETDFTIWKTGASVRLTTFDGMRISMMLWSSGEEFLLRIDAAFDPGEARQPEPDPRKGPRAAGLPSFGHADSGGIGNIGAPSILSGVKEAGNIGIGGPGSRKKPPPGKEAVKKEATELAGRWNDWVYVLPRNPMGGLIQWRADPVQKPPALPDGVANR